MAAYKSNESGEFIYNIKAIDKVIDGQNNKDSDDIVPNMKKRYFSKISLKSSVNSLNCFTAQYD